MPDEYQLTIRQTDQTRADFAAIGLEFIKSRLPRLSVIDRLRRFDLWLAQSPARLFRLCLGLGLLLGFVSIRTSHADARNHATVHAAATHRFREEPSTNACYRNCYRTR